MPLRETEETLMISKKTFKIIITAALSVIILFELGYIVRQSMQSPETEHSGIAGTIAAADKTVKINNEDIPAYTISGMDNIFLSATDLEPFGFVFTDSGTSYSLSYGGEYSADATAFEASLNGAAAYTAPKPLDVNGSEFTCYTSDDTVLIPDSALNQLGSAMSSDASNTIYFAFGSDEEIKASFDISSREIAAAENALAAASTQGSDMSIASDTSAPVIVLDPGHGKSSSLMDDDEKRSSGWVQNSSGEWGEWRHYKTDSSTEDCESSGCSGRAPENGSCWYPIENGDRATEPEINLSNALAAQKYLESMGYTVRLTRTTNDENPSITRRLSYCYPDNDTSQDADAEMFVCIHSNAGGGSGSAYISLDGLYDQRGITDTYADDSNRLGRYINDCIVSETSLSRSGNGIISFEPELIAFCKSPVPCGYLEIGFFDDPSDLEILNSESDSIGKAIADGINTYYTELQNNG